MRILIDTCLPKQLKGWIAGGHDAVTAQEMGWANVRNDKLLHPANEAGFDVSVTADKDIYYQQNLTGLQISAVVIPGNRKLLVQRSTPAFLQSLGHIQPDQKVVVDFGLNADAWQPLRLHTIEQQEQYTTHIFKFPE